MTHNQFKKAHLNSNILPSFFNWLCDYLFDFTTEYVLQHDIFNARDSHPVHEEENKEKDILNLVRKRLACAQAVVIGVDVPSILIWFTL